MLPGVVYCHLTMKRRQADPIYTPGKRVPLGELQRGAKQCHERILALGPESAIEVRTSWSRSQSDRAGKTEARLDGVLLWVLNGELCFVEGQWRVQLPYLMEAAARRDAGGFQHYARPAFAEEHEALAYYTQAVEAKARELGLKDLREAKAQILAASRRGTSPERKALVDRIAELEKQVAALDAAIFAETLAEVIEGSK